MVEHLAQVFKQTSGEATITAGLKWHHDSVNPEVFMALIRPRGTILLYAPTLDPTCRR
jgi:hypothetical protein